MQGEGAARNATGTVAIMFRRAVRVVTLGGVDIRLDPSLVLLAALLLWVLDARLGLRFAPATSLALAALGSLLLILSVLAHELGHALEARRRGLQVGGITLFALGGATELGGHGRSPREELAVAFAGPSCPRCCALRRAMVSSDRKSVV